MSRDPFLDLLIAAATKPHRNCIHRTLRTHTLTLPRQSIRFSSTTPPTTKPSSRPPPTPIRPSPAQIPLHVGLDRNPSNLSSQSHIPIPQGTKNEHFTPSPLSHPLGLPYPPQVGQNSPLDPRTLSDRKRDFTSPTLALERRQIYLRSFLRPYFQEWKRFDKQYKGKSFVSNERLFRREKALYFPNIWGSTLSLEGDGPDGGRDTTPLLRGKVSIVAIRSNQWANEQVESFIGKQQNPALEGLVDGSGGLGQRVDINIQGDWARLLLVRLFKNGLRKEIPEDRWGKYFMVKLPRDVRKGLTDDVRDAMGLLNSQVGYVYLVDGECKIRWAGSAHAWDGEVASLNNGFKKLLQEASGVPQKPRATGTTSKLPTTNSVTAVRPSPVAMPA